MQLKILNTINLLAVILILMAVSCADDFPYRGTDIPEGEGILSATVTFTPIASSELGTTRTDGDAIQNIESLCVLVYDKNKNFVKKYSKEDLKNYNDKNPYVVDQSKDYLDGEGAHTDEKQTARASFELTDLPYGQYYIFAVANMSDLSGYDVSTVDKLQNIQLNWNPGDIRANNQMFGYFTPEKNMESTGFEPEKPLTFTGRATDSKIHAWLKRAASKVTVAFDPSGLNQGVSIYIRNVTIRDIPKTCLLGAENTPTNVNDLYNHLSSYENPDYTKPTIVEENSRLEYDSEGVITDGTSTGSSSTSGLKLDNSIRSAVPKNAHAVNAPSLFFYENNQDAWLQENHPDFKSDSRFDKQPQREGDDKIGTTIHDPKDGKDFKDRVPYGTYVEVEAYYISSNPANPGEGTIKYRFMLGKDTSFDYDAQRNYHYKLTLGFKGWANDPDWHIDYVITTPSIEVQPVFRVSYLYQQKSELPIKIVGDVQYLTVTITENNWAPYDPNTTEPITLGAGEYAKEYKIPSAIVESEPAEYQFKWNREAFDNQVYLNPSTNNPDDPNVNYPYNLPPGQERPEFGFLALHLPSRATTAVPDEYNLGSNTKLINYWRDNQEGIRRFSNVNGNEDFSIGEHNASWGDIKSIVTEDDKYTVNSVLNDNNVAIENQRILMLPVWTRTKTLIKTSGFSGNNPYEAFERKAIVHIAGTFKVGEETKRIEKDVEVYQVKRITNPKGVWRAHDRTESFNVTLLEAANSNAESNFEAFTSQGEWTAFIDEQTNGGGFSIRPNGETNGYMENGVIHGNSGSEIHFAINFGNRVAENQSECAVVKVLYHGNQCMHKILVRKGYNSPLEMGAYTDEDENYHAGTKWSSFSLYQATSTGETVNGRTVYDAILTKNPLMLGSMFRRQGQNQGIFVWNNMQSDLGVDKAPGNIQFVVGAKADGVTIKPGLTGDSWKSQWKSQTWTNIDYQDDRNTSNNLGIYYALDDEGNHTTDENGNPLKYRVPTFAEYKSLMDNSEFGFGVFYGSSATEPQKESQNAYGLIDPYNEGLFNDKNGMRAVVAYDKSNGNQILFPIGRYGIGVRRMYNLANIGGGSANYNTYAGNLHYSDVYQPLTISYNARNLYRPIPYNLPMVSGCIYWIDQYVAASESEILSEPCLGWDMNYFNFDFNPYTANNWRDACPIKFVIDDTPATPTTRARVKKKK